MAPIQQPDLSWPWHLLPTLGKDQLTDIRIRAVGGFLRNAVTQEKSFTYFLKNLCSSFNWDLICIEILNAFSTALQVGKI